MTRLLAVQPVALRAAAAEPARAFQARAGVFTAERDCAALVSLRRGTNPDSRRLQPGGRYAVLGLNERDGAWVQVRVPDASPAERWVERGCGRLEAERRADQQAPGLPPFFDSEVAGPNDPTPPPPALGALDEAILEVCGPWGSRPERAVFRQILDRSRLTGEVAELHRLLEGRVTGAPLDLSAFKDALAEAWFAAGGFRHVFCGEPTTAGIGGLHYRGRLLQLQQEGLAGLAPVDRCRASEIDPPVYTVGVLYRTADGRIELACPKSYAADLDARAILVAATRAMAAAEARGRRMCLAPVSDVSGGRYLSVLVQDDGAIVTFYPDATPSCPTGAPARTCLCAEETG